MQKLSLVVLLTIACGSTRASAEPRTYHLDPGRPSTVEVHVDVPATWKDEVDATGQVDWKPAGQTPFVLGVYFLACPATASTNDACVEAAVRPNFGTAQTKVEPGSAGSRWVTADTSRPAHPQLHMRRFVPVLAKHRVVMCAAVLSGADRSLAPDVRKVCDTLTAK